EDRETCSLAAAPAEDGQGDKDQDQEKARRAGVVIARQALPVVREAARPGGVKARPAVLRIRDIPEEDGEAPRPQEPKAERVGVPPDQLRHRNTQPGDGVTSA